MSGGVMTALRTVLSLVVVLAIVFAAARLLGRASGQGGSGALDVLARQALGRTASVAIVRVADRAYVLGVTEHQITLLDDTDLTQLTEVIAAGRSAEGFTARQGNIFSAAAWRQGIEAVRDRTARR
jgi:flagellar protein FliO/FliZ